MPGQDRSHLVETTAQIVSAYLVNNAVPATSISALVADVSAAVGKLSFIAAAPEPAPTPTVNPKRSVHPDYIVSLEDGAKYKSLKRHLATKYGMTPDEYRAKWGLPRDYPMVAPNYAAARSALAKKMGLGRKAKPQAQAKLAKKSGKSGLRSRLAHSQKLAVAPRDRFGVSRRSR